MVYRSVRNPQRVAASRKASWADEVNPPWRNGSRDCEMV